MKSKRGKVQTLKRKIIQSSGILLIALFAVAYLILLVFNIYFETQQYKSARQTHEDWCVQEITGRLGVMDKAVSILRVDDGILEMFQRNVYGLEYGDPAEKIKDTKMLRDKVQQICTALELESIMFFIPYGENSPTGLIDEYVYNDELLDAEFGAQNAFLDADNEKLQYNHGLTDETFWRRVTGQISETKKGVVYTSFYRLSNYSQTEYYGCIAISMSKDVVARNIAALYGGGDEYFLTIQDINNDLLLYSNGDTDRGNVVVLDGYGLKIVQVLNSNEVLNVIISSAVFFLVMATSCFILINVSLKTHKRIFNDIHGYISDMDKTEKANVEVPQYKEFIEISEKFNRLIEKLNGEILEKSAYEVAQKEAQLMSLQYQINPHFMFNMIEIFRMRLEASGDIEAGESMKDFGLFLRYNLRGEQEVTLDEEIRMVERFIGLFRFKYGDRLTHEARILDELKGERCVKFILQPLVENSIKYGFKGRNKLHISIEAFLQDGAIVLRVTDDGCGIEEEKLKEIVDNLGTETSSGYSIGLSNVYRRIKLFYGEKGSLNISSEKGKGTCVEIRFFKGERNENSVD